MADAKTMNSVLDAIFSPTFKPIQCLQRQFNAHDYTGVPIGGHTPDGKRITAGKRQKARLCNKRVKENHVSVEIRLDDLNQKSELKKLAQFKTSGYRVVRLDDYYESLSLSLDENDNVITGTNESAKQFNNADEDSSIGCVDMEAGDSFLEDTTFQPEIAKVESLNELSFEVFDSKTLQRLEPNLQEVDVNTTDKDRVTPNSDNLNAQEYLDCETRDTTGNKTLHLKDVLNEKDVQSIKQNTDPMSVTHKDSQLAHSKEMFETSASGSNFEIYIDIDCDVEEAETFGNTLSPDSAYGTEHTGQVCLNNKIEKLSNKCFSVCHQSALTDDLSLTRENDQAAQSYLCKTKSVEIVRNKETKTKKSGKSHKAKQCSKENVTDVPSETKADKNKRAIKTKKSNSVLKENVTSDDDKPAHERHTNHNSDPCKVKQNHVKVGKDKPKQQDVSENNSKKTDTKGTSKAVKERINTSKSASKLNEPHDDVDKENTKISREQKQTKRKMENKISSKENGKFDNKHIREKHLESVDKKGPEVQYMSNSVIKTHREKLIERCANTRSVENKNSENSSSKVEICMEQGVERSIQVLSKSDRDPKPNSLLEKEKYDVNKKLKNSSGANNYISKNKDKTSLTEKAENGKVERNSDKFDSTAIDMAKHRKDNYSETLQDDIEAISIIKQGSSIKEKEVFDTKMEKEVKENVSKGQKHEEKSHNNAGKIKIPSDLSNQSLQPKKNIKPSKQTEKQPLNIENRKLENMEDARSSIQGLSKPKREPESNRLLQNEEHESNKKLRHSSASKDFITKKKDKSSSSERAENAKRDKNTDSFDRTAIDKAKHRKDKLSQKLLEVTVHNSIVKQSSDIEDNDVKESLSKGRKHEENNHNINSELMCPSDLSSHSLQPKKNTTTPKQIEKSLSAENRIRKNIEDVKNVTFHSENNIPRKYLECFVKLTDCRAKEYKPVNSMKRKLSSTDFIEKTAKKRVIQWLERHTSENDVDELQEDNIAKPPITKLNFKIPKRSKTTEPQTYHKCKYCKNIRFETLERLYRHVKREHREKRKSESKNGDSSSHYKDVRRESGVIKYWKGSLDEYLSNCDRDNYELKNEIERFRSERKHSESRKSDGSSSHRVKNDNSHARRSSSKEKRISEKNVMIKNVRKENCNSSETKREVSESSFRKVTEKQCECVRDSDTSLTKSGRHYTEKNEIKHKTNKRTLHDNESTAVKNKPASSESKTTLVLLKLSDEDNQDLLTRDNIKENIMEDLGSKKDLKQKQNRCSNSGEHGEIKAYGKTIADGFEGVKVSQTDDISTKSGNVKRPIKCNICEKSYFTKRHGNEKHMCSEHSDRSDKIYKSSERVKITQNDHSEELVEKRRVDNIAVSQRDENGKCKANTSADKTIRNNLNNCKLKNSEKKLNKDKLTEINVQTVGQQNRCSNSGEHGEIKAYGKTIADGFEGVKVSQTDDISTKSGNVKRPIKCNICEKSYFTKRLEYERHMCSKHSDRSDKIYKSSEKVKITQNDHSEELVEKRHVDNLAISQRDESGKCKANANADKTITNNLNNFKLKNSEKKLNKDKLTEINVQTVGQKKQCSNSGEHGEKKAYGKTIADGFEGVKVSQTDDISTKSGNVKRPIKCNICEKSYFTKRLEYERHMGSKHSDRSDKIYKSSETK